MGKIHWEYIVSQMLLQQCSLTGPVGQLFASRLGGSSSCPGDAPPLTTEPGSPVSDVLLQEKILGIHLEDGKKLERQKLDPRKNKTIT